MMTKKTKYVTLMSITIFSVIAVYSFFYNKGRKTPILEARLLVVKDNKMWADSLDSVENRRNEDNSHREIYFRYEIGNDSEDTLYFPLASNTEMSSKSHISVKIKDMNNTIPQLSFVWKNNSYKIAPHEVIDISFTVCKIFTVEEERKNNTNIYDLLPRFQMEYKLDSVDIRQNNLPVPNIRFNNDTTGIKVRFTSMNDRIGCL